MCACSIVRWGRQWLPAPDRAQRRGCSQSLLSSVPPRPWRGWWRGRPRWRPAAGRGSSREDRTGGRCRPEPRSGGRSGWSPGRSRPPLWAETQSGHHQFPSARHQAREPPSGSVPGCPCLCPPGTSPPPLCSHQGPPCRRWWWGTRWPSQWSRARTPADSPSCLSQPAVEREGGRWERGRERESDQLFVHHVVIFISQSLPVWGHPPAIFTPGGEEQDKVGQITLLRKLAVSWG